MCGEDEENDNPKIFIFGDLIFLDILVLFSISEEDVILCISITLEFNE